MGHSTIIDVIGSFIIGGLLIVNLLKLNATVIENETHFSHDKSVQLDVVIIATLIDRDFNLMGYCGNHTQLRSDSTLVYGDAESIIFIADLDNNGIYDLVHYYLSDTSALSHTPNPRDRLLYRRINSDQPLIIGNNITEFNLEYLDGLRNPITPPVNYNPNVNFVKVSFKVEDPFAYEENYSQAVWRRLTVTTKNLVKQ